MNQKTISEIIADQTVRALWEIKNVIDCVPEGLWNKEYCEMPLWKHIYHMLHSLDLWLINPRAADYKEPLFHEKNMNNLNVVTEKQLSPSDMDSYYSQIRSKVKPYLKSLQDDCLLEMPEGCEYTKFTLLLAQHRHLHTHMGMLMGFIVAETGLWPKVVGLEGEIPGELSGIYF